MFQLFHEKNQALSLVSMWWHTLASHFQLETPRRDLALNILREEQILEPKTLGSNEAIDCLFNK